MSDKWLDDDELKGLLGEEVKPTNSKNEMDDELLKQLLEDDDDDGADYDLPKKEVETSKVSFEEITDFSFSENDKADFELLMDIPMEVRVLLGTVEKTIEEILEMHEGSVVKMDQLAGEPVEILVGDQVVAKGETVIIDDKFGVLITEIVPPRERIRSIEGKLKRQKE